MQNVKAIHCMKGVCLSNQGNSSFTANPLVPSIIKSTAFKAVKEAPQQLTPQRPTKSSSGWPEAAVLDWKSWGHKNPPGFFEKWPELAL